jgi:3',5'-cyclic AMP phosphodiesterase CpdA
MNAPIRFAQISDTHVRPDAIGRSQVLADHMAEIQAGGYDFVVHTGDLMDEPSAWAARAFRAMISQLQIPVYFVPGNHDVYNPPMGGIEAPWWARLEVDSALEARYRSWFGPSWHASSYRGVHLVGFDSLIVNSGLPEEAQQWAWLEETLKELAGRREQLVLFTHLPLFVRQPDEELDAADFANRYLVIAPPGRDRLLDLIRQHRVAAVLSGHIHAPWARSHTWPEGFTTQFVSTGSSGKPSAMAIEQFDLPLSVAEGLGYHEHWVTEYGLVSRYHQHTPPAGEGRWTLGQAWTTVCRNGRMPPEQDGLHWYDAGYRPLAPKWQQAAPVSQLALGGQDSETFYLRQAFEARDRSAALYLELLSEADVEIYLNGELVYKLDALHERPQAWTSAGGTYTIDSPALHLSLSQRLVRKGENALALQVRGAASSGDRIDEYIAYRELRRGEDTSQVAREREAEPK